MGRRGSFRSGHGLVPAMNAPGHKPWPNSPGSMHSMGRNRRRSSSLVSPRAARPSIKAVTFDVGGTLLEVWPSVGHVYAEVAARHGAKGLSASLLNRRFAAAWRASRHFRHSRSDWAELVDATFQGLTDRPPSETFFDELYARFAAPDAWRVFDDVVPTLKALASHGLELGVISNWDERLRPLLEQLKLADYFKAIVVSREVHAAKPSRAIFRHAVRNLGLPPEGILHVGDDLSMDVRGAQAAGLSALLLKRRDGTAKEGQIKSLRDLC